MKNTVKSILSGVMIFFDLLLMAFFFGDMMSGYDVGIDIFMLLFLTTDMLLSIDYIGKLNKQSKETAILEEEERLKRLRRFRERKQPAQRPVDEDAAMAADIRRRTEAAQADDEIDPDELAEMLSGTQGTNQSQPK